MEEKERTKILLDKCYHYLGVRPRSEHEMRVYLQKRKEPQDIIEKVLAILAEKKFVNDYEFVRWWIEQRSYRRQKGEMILKKELLQKGVHNDIITEVLEDEPIDEIELAKSALSAKSKILQRLTIEERYKKAIMFLQRRGFTYSIAKKAFEEWSNIKYNTDTL